MATAKLGRLTGDRSCSSAALETATWTGQLTWFAARSPSSVRRNTEATWTPQVLARWLANKTPVDFRRWIGSADRSVCVAVGDDGQLAAVGMVAWRGEILLNYVAPEARFLGASKALVAHMEDHLRARGVDRVVLLSTHVACWFYRSIGYEECGRIESRFGTLDAIEMAKPLG